MGVPERLWMGGMSHRMYQSTGLGQMNSAKLKLAGTHKIAVKNLEQTGADLWSFHVGESPVHVKSSCGACSGSRKNCLCSRRW